MERHIDLEKAQKGRLITDVSDVLLVAAIATLPVDGLKIGIAMPYWTPIAPLFFVLYAIFNVKYLVRSMRKFAGFYVFFIALIALSFFGWMTIGFHTLHVFRTLFALLAGLACLASLDIAFRLKRVSRNKALILLMVVYWLVFVVGIVQWYGCKTNDASLTALFERLMERNYMPRKPQFLFAESSYIGMHLFGVLLPLFWLTKRRSLAVLVVVFAVGSAIMGVGVRILIDAVVALLLWVVIAIPWGKKSVVIPAVAGLGAIGAGGAVVLSHDSRVQSLLGQGILQGDFSTFARIFRTICPLMAGYHDHAHLLFGFGAGNLKDAIKRGYQPACDWLNARGGDTARNGEIGLLANPHTEDYYFTMNGYVSFIAEFGVVMLIALFALVIAHITINKAWNKRNICWLLLLMYLYLQFEAYAFYAFWLFIWAIGMQNNRNGVKRPIGRHAAVKNEAAIA